MRLALFSSTILFTACAYHAPRATLFPLGPAIIRGVVVDSITGKPLEASVVWLQLDSVQKQSRNTSADGRFVFAQMPRTAFTLVVGHIGYYMVHLPVSTKVDSLITLSVRLQVRPIE